jgi:hypothetical protein
MRIFHDILTRDKITDESIRWMRLISGVKFQLYIIKWRVPEPVPDKIEVSIFSHKELYHRDVTRLGKKSIKDLSAEDRVYLDRIDLNESRIRVAGPDAILGAAYFNEKSDPINTVRYNAGRDESLEFGDPYIPRSIFEGKCPPYLLFLVRWLP